MGLVGWRNVASIVADEQNLGAGAHRAVLRVVENIALEGARSLQCKAGSFEPLAESGNIIYAKFDLGLDGHRQK